MTVWTEVPDPRDDNAPCQGHCQVAASERAWRHIAEEHAIPPGEPWDEWLTPAVASRFRGIWSAGATEPHRASAIAEVAAVVEKEMKRCLTVPLALIYDDYQPPSQGRPTRAEETWGLVLPSGAFLIVRSDPAGGHVRTCYFKDAACRIPDQSQRWRAVVENVVLTYATVGPDGTRRPLGNADAVAVNGGLRVRIRFRTNRSWQVDGSSRRPWVTVPDPWGCTPPSPTPAVGLLPRRTY